MIKNIINFIFYNNYFEKKLENAYKILEKNNQVEEIYKIKESLQNVNYNEKVIDNDFQDYNLDINLALNQFIYSKFINTPFFTSKLIFSIAYNEKFYFPVPLKFLDIINKTVKVSFLKSKILFYLTIIIFFIYQFFSIIRNVLYFFRSKKNIENKIFLNSIPNLYSDTTNDSKNFDFYKWVISYFKLDSKIGFFHCNKFINDKNVKFNQSNYETHFIQNPLIPFFKIENFKFFIKSLIKTLSLSLKIIFFSKIELLFLTREIFFFNYLKKLPNNLFYNYCLFNNSNMVFRPFWTYVNEKKNNDSVVLYFYSTNMMPLLQEINQKKYYEVYGYSLHSWPAYITWNKEQTNWLSKNINFKSKFYKESIVPFSGKYLQLKKEKRTITIFDVPPKKSMIYNLLNNPYNIYTVNYCEKFLKDIINSIPENFFSKVDIIIKLKKDYSNIDPSYRVLINDMINNNKVKLIKDVSPESVIDISDATISIPFTSTAITSLNKNKNTIYFDPSGKLTKKNCLEKNINLISSKNDLEKWFLEVLNK